MRNLFLVRFLLVILLFNSISIKASAFVFEDGIEEMIMDGDPYVGVTIELEKFQPMVFMSNLTPEVYPSKYVQNIDKIITSLAQSKKIDKKLFKDNKKIVKFLNPREKFTIVQVLKTAVYKENIPEEYTTYIVKNSKNELFGIPDFELKELKKIKLNDYESDLVEKTFNNQGLARLVVYFIKPEIYARKKAPFDKEALDSVFDFFFDNISGYEYSDLKKSNRNFRLTMTVTLDTLAYIISEYDNLYIEDMEIIEK